VLARESREGKARPICPRGFRCTAKAQHLVFLASIFGCGRRPRCAPLDGTDYEELICTAREPKVPRTFSRAKRAFAWMISSASERQLRVTGCPLSVGNPPFASCYYLFQSCFLAQIPDRRECKSLKHKHLVLTRSHKATESGRHFRVRLLRVLVPLCEYVFGLRRKAALGDPRISRSEKGSEFLLPAQWQG